MKILRYIAFSVIVLAAQAYSQRLESVFEGNKALPSAKLLEALSKNGITSYRNGIDRPIRDVLLREYQSAGFLFAEIQRTEYQFTPDSSSVTARINIKERRRLLTGTISFLGADSIHSPVLLEQMELIPGSVFSQKQLEADIMRIIDFYEEHGFPFAEIHLQRLDLRDDSLGLFADAVLAVDEGSPFYIDEIRIEGNSVTDADVIVRETRLREGERFSAEKIDDVRSRVERLGFFSSVAEPALYRRDGKGGMLLSVKEGNTTLIDGIVGYQPPASNESSGYVTGQVNISFRNLFGSGRKLAARWERATREVSELELSFLEPWIFSYPVNVSGSYYQRQQDSSYVRRTMHGTLAYLASASLSLAAGIVYAQVIPSATTSFVNPLQSSNTLSGSLEVLIDTRDDLYNPMSGVLLRNSYSGGYKRFREAAGGAEVTDFLQRIELDLSYFQLLFPRNILALSLHGRELKGNETDASDLYRLGGATSLRGYREEQFAGTRLLWLNSEYRFSLGRRSFAFVFYDFGYIYQSENQKYQRSEFKEFRSGYGIGGRLETSLGVMGVSYALGKDDTFSTGKIHFGLITEF